ncbi:MAG: BspA family leucine-rich repeat surface protein [Paludibacteraceae bacterium]|nr:BspA family leucine-rich repeat surface protein [Paludibacteraceae bacterium]
MKRFFLLMSVILMAMSMSAETYGPLLTAKWSYEAPFNNQCKFVYNGTSYQCQPGPTAIAASMVLYYWQYPETIGALDEYSGQLSYSIFSTANGYSYPALPATTFKWDKIKEEYAKEETGEAADAVAELVHYAGHAQQIDYGVWGSGLDMEKADNIVTMFVQFGYDSKTCRLAAKSDYSESEWATLIQDEIKAGRPVVYMASSIIGGHAFVVDGYDPSNDTYHVNFGWGGDDNGWLEMNSFKVEDEEETNTYTYTFNQNQMAVVGIQPLTDAEPYAVLTDSETDEGKKTLTFYYDASKAAWQDEVGEEKVFDVPWDVDTDSNTDDKPGWASEGGNTSITTVEFNESFKDYDGLKSTSYMFWGLTALETINHLEYLNTENVTNMTAMFAYCNKLTTLDVSNFEISDGLTDMDEMFAQCTSLETIYCAEGADWSTSGAYKSNMFNGCTSLSGKCGSKKFECDGENDVDGTYAKAYMGDDDEGGYFTVREAYAVLSDDGKTLTFRYDAEKPAEAYNIPWDTSESSPFGGFGGSGNTRRPGWLVENANENITTVIFDETFANYHDLPSTAYMFFKMSNLETIEHLENLKTENVKSMYGMFSYCENLTSLDLSSFNTEQVTEMDYLFEECSGLRSVDLSSFNTAKVSNMTSMFRNCSSLTSLDVSNFNTASVTKMMAMFKDCSSLTSLDLSNFNIDKVDYMYAMFSGCSKLETIYCAEGADWSGVAGRNYIEMFSGCEKLSGKYGSKEFKFDGTEDGTYAKVYDGTNGGYFTYKGNRSYTLEVGEAGMATLYLDFDAVIPEGVEVYCCEGLKDDEALPEAYAVKITQGVIPANTGVFVKAEPGKYLFNAFIPVETDGVTQVLQIYPDNILTGTLEEKEVGSHEVLTLGYSNQTNELGFWWFTGKTPIPANRAYIPGDKLTEGGVKGIRIVFDEETGIEEIVNGKSSNGKSLGAWYTIDGRKLEGKPQQRGLYINNGKKIIIK